MATFTRTDDLHGAEFIGADLRGARFVRADPVPWCARSPLKRSKSRDFSAQSMVRPHFDAGAPEVSYAVPPTAALTVT